MQKKEKRSPRSAADKAMQSQLEALTAAVKAQQDAMLILISKQAGVPMDEPLPEPEPPAPPITLESLKLELADHFIEAWTCMNNPNNSRQAAVVAKMSTPRMQKLLKTILDWKK